MAKVLSKSQLIVNVKLTPPPLGSYNVYITVYLSMFSHYLLLLAFTNLIAFGSSESACRLVFEDKDRKRPVARLECWSLTIR